MNLSALLAVGQTALELGLICALTVLALFLSYSMLNVCDLSTDGCFTLGAAVGAVVAVAGHPLLSIPAAMGAGICSGFITALLQTKLGINSLLAGIIVNTGLYSVNIAVMSGKAQVSLNQAESPFTIMKDLLAGTPLESQYKVIVAAVPEYPLGNGDSGDGEQPRYGPLLLYKSGVHYDCRPVYGKRHHRTLWLSHGPIPKSGGN